MEVPEVEVKELVRQVPVPVVQYIEPLDTTECGGRTRRENAGGSCFCSCLGEGEVVFWREVVHKDGCGIQEGSGHQDVLLTKLLTQFPNTTTGKQMHLEVFQNRRRLVV